MAVVRGLSPLFIAVTSAALMSSRIIVSLQAPGEGDRGEDSRRRGLLID
jgi:hypothetical protein